VAGPRAAGSSRDDSSAWRRLDLRVRESTATTRECGGRRRKRDRRLRACVTQGWCGGGGTHGPAAARVARGGGGRPTGREAVQEPDLWRGRGGGWRRRGGAGHRRHGGGARWSGGVEQVAGGAHTCAADQGEGEKEENLGRYHVRGVKWLLN
jgi:hypothetical protein